jgi:lipopolysaccharide transport system permease protein
MDNYEPNALHNPLVAQSNASLTVMMRSLYQNRILILRMARRELESRFRGSRLGVAWIVLQPLLMLAVYTFAFGVILKARWGQDSSDSPWDYALFLFTGLLVFNVFAEVVTRAPTLMLENISYIKNMVFPTEIIAVSNILVAIFNFFVGFIILMVLYVCVRGIPPVTTLFIFLPLIPLIFFTMGLAWFLSALGVYIRDLRQIVGIAVTAIMFLCPLFYPLSILPDGIRSMIALNPLASIIEAMRDLVFYGRLPQWQSYGISFVASMLVAWLGYAWFIKTRKGFSDVV